MSQVQWKTESPLIHTVHAPSATIPHETHNTVQFLGRHEEGFTLRFSGAEHKIFLRTPLEHEMYAHMQRPAVLDTSKTILSPMPGTLISVAVTAGQKVRVVDCACRVDRLFVQR